VTGVQTCALPIFTLNRNTIPNDPNGPWYTSGLRLGTPALTSLGMGPSEMKEVAAIVVSVLKGTRAAAKKDGTPSQVAFDTEPRAVESARARVAELLARHPLYPQVDLA